ncbi:MAG: hypothetical protein WCK08_03105 [Betaproteobacteria bacterium]
MQTMIVFVDDADHALRELEASGFSLPAHEAVRWVLVGCAPRVTQHVSRWVTRSARENWRSRWADKLFTRLAPPLQLWGGEVITCMAKTHLPAHTDALLLEHPAARVLDLRRARSPQQGSDEASPGRQLMPALLLTLSSSLWVMAE